MAGLAKESEEAAQNGEHNALTRRKIKSKSKKSVPVRSKEGVRITTEAGQIERWKQHFEKVLNLPVPQSAVDEIEKEALDIDTDPASVDEIISSLKRLRNGKAPGINNIKLTSLKWTLGLKLVHFSMSSITSGMTK